MMQQQIVTGAGEILFSGELDGWNLSSRTSTEGGVTFLELRLDRPDPAMLPFFRLLWHTSALDCQCRWTPLAGNNKLLPPNWGSRQSFQLAIGAPVMCFLNQAGVNRLTFACSDALNVVQLGGGIEEKLGVLECSVECFRTPGAPASEYCCTLRIDSRPVRFEEALADVASWWAAMPEYAPSPVPEPAREPMYSTWYSFHQDLFDHEVEEQCALAAKFDLKSVIVDDGWQTEDNHGGYAFCGDWEICRKRFPNMAAHVRRIHALGLKYLLWYSMPWAGFESAAYRKFAGKLLYRDERLNAAALDPRFPEVREYLIGIYERALHEWDLDGFKLDFIDSFEFRPAGSEDPAIAENYAGRDYKSLALAVDRLLTDTMNRLRAIKPEIMIEFRQRYTGPAMRKYGNMFRAADCPYDAVSNRIRTIDVRLLAGNTAVHADMLMWHRDESVEVAALQFLNILFAVPQISVRLEVVPESHRAMLRFYLGFWREYRDVLLDGTLRAEHPELNYPVVSARSGSRSVVAVYGAGSLVELDPAPGEEVNLVDATGCGRIVLSLARAPREAAAFTATGVPAEIPTPGAGCRLLTMPVSGVLRLRF